MKAREESTSLSRTKDEEHKIDEITSLLRNLSSRISRVETHPRVTQQVANRPQFHYRRPFQHQILQRPNTDQKTQPTLMINDEYPKENVPINTNELF